jgi:hypothetical protein
MAEPIDEKQQHLDDRSEAMFELVETPKPKKPGLTGAEARAFLRKLHPVLAARQSLKDAAKKVTSKG